MDLYQKVEKVILQHIEDHKLEVRKGKELLGKLDIVRCNAPTQDYSFNLDATGEKNEKIEHSPYYYDWDRNGKTTNPFEIPDYTELPD